MTLKLSIGQVIECKMKDEKYCGETIEIGDNYIVIEEAHDRGREATVLLDWIEKIVQINATMYRLLFKK